MIYIATDHAGFEVKKDLLEYFKKKNIPVTDLGPEKSNPADDYPDYAFALAKQTAQFPGNLGILVCRSGIGMTIAANKVKGVRAALCTAVLQAQKSRDHNNANVLVLAADYTSFEDMKKIIDAFLTTPFSGEERHQRRINKITAFENKL